VRSRDSRLQDQIAVAPRAWYVQLKRDSLGRCQHEGPGMLFLLIAGLEVVCVIALVLARGASAFERAGDAEPSIGHGGETILRYGPGRRAYDAITPVALALTAVLTGIYPATQDRSVLVGGLTAASILATWSALGTWRQVVVSEEAVSLVPILGHRTSVLWSEVAGVEYSRLRGCITLRTHGGQKLRVDMRLQGFKAFVSLVREHLPTLSRAALTRVPSDLQGTEADSTGSGLTSA
jgi:hypothetical protein